MFAFALAIAFVSWQEPAKEQKVDVDRFITDCVKLGEKRKSQMVSYVNLQIGLLRFLKKAKIDPGSKQYVNINTGQEGAPIYTANFPSGKARDAYEKTLKAEIQKQKQEIYEYKTFALPTIGPNYTENRWGIPETEVVEILQVVNSDSLLAFFLPEFRGRELALLRGFSTEGLADGRRLKMAEPIVPDGTYNYEAVSGAGRTVTAYRLMTESEINALIKHKESLSCDACVRNWVSSDGKHTTTATLVSFDLLRVKLQKEDGTVVELELPKLSKEDQRYVKRALGLDAIE